MVAWMRRVPRPLAAAGAAVVPIDHITKSGDNNLYASGTQRKRAGITGASYLVENRSPFSQGHRGMSRLVCAKDRHGNPLLIKLSGPVEAWFEDKKEG